MAVVKATYTKSRGGAKASIRYIATRPGRNGEKITRQLFGHDGALSLAQAYGMVDEATKGTNFFRLVLSPDPTQEDRLKDMDMWEFARQTVVQLEGRLKKEIQFVAAEHNDHTPIRHVHVIALLPGKLNVADLEALRMVGTQAALFQRQERDLALVAQQAAREAVPQPPFARTVYPADGAYGAGSPPEGNRGKSLLDLLLQDEAAEEKTSRPPAFRSKPLSDVTICHLCGKRVGKGYTKCFNCGARLEISLDIGDNGLSYDW